MNDEREGEERDKGAGMSALAVGALIVVGLLILFLILRAGMRLPTSAPEREGRRSRASEEARRTRCRSNLRVLGLAIVMYANDNRGWTPAIDPGARALANAAGVPGGCVLCFADEDGTWKASGLGLLYAGGYVTARGGEFNCPSISGEDPVWVDAFSFDGGDGLWTSRYVAPTNGNGVGELPDNPDVMITNYVLRPNGDNAWGAWRMSGSRGKALVSDLLPVLPDGAVTNHGDMYNILFDDGSVRTFSDAGGVVAGICAKATPDDVEEVVGEVFSTYFDLIYSSE